MAVSTLTPTQSGGGPGQIYIMHRDGMHVGTAVTVMLVSCLGTMIALLCTGLAAAVAGGIDGSRQMLVAVLWTLTIVASLVVVLAIPPRAFLVALRAVGRPFRPRGGPDAVPTGRAPVGTRRPALPDRTGRLARTLSDLLATYRRDTALFARRGKLAFLLVCALSVAFVVSRAVMAYLVVRFMGIDASSFRHIVEVQIVLLLVEFMAPTPGGAGVVEGASLALMGDIVPSGHAPYYTLLWRAATLYLPAVAGFVCLATALVQDARRVGRPDAWRVMGGATSAKRGLAMKERLDPA